MILLCTTKRKSVWSNAVAATAANNSSTTNATTSNIMAQLGPHFYAKPTPIHFCHCPTCLGQCYRWFFVLPELQFYSFVSPTSARSTHAWSSPPGSCSSSPPVCESLLHLANPHPLQLLQVIDCVSSLGMFFHSRIRIRHTWLWNSIGNCDCTMVIITTAVYHSSRAHWWDTPFF